MATAAPNQNLPLFYNAVEPLNVTAHGKLKVRPVLKMPQVGRTHAIPLTVDEFTLVQRHYPIVFTVGETPIPIALMGLNEGVNTFIDDKGKLLEDVYIPAYARRYPYLLAKLTPESEELSLCFDPSSGMLGDFKDGESLFDSEGKPAEAVQGALDFCQKFEEAGAKTQAFIQELNRKELLMDGEIAITRNDDPERPYVYRGFKMVNEEKLRALDAETAQQWTANGIMALIFAHMFSMDVMRVIFGRQMAQNKVPAAAEQPAA